MQRILNSKIFKYVYITLTLLVAMTLLINTAITFVRAWFTDDLPPDYQDAKVAQVDIRILQNGTEMGGKVEITHNNNFIQSDDVYTFTPGTTPVYDMPAVGSSVSVNLEVQNLGWADGLVRLVGFEIYYLETTPRGDTNELVAHESEMTIDDNSEVWVTEYTDSVFDAGDPELNVISYNMYLNRTLAENEKATVATKVTNNTLSNTTYTKFYIRFLAEITVYESNAYQTSGNYPPFGNNVPSAWTAWQKKTETE